MEHTLHQSASCPACHGSGKAREKVPHILGVATFGFAYLADAAYPEYVDCPYCGGDGLTQFGRRALANKDHPHE